MMIFPVGCIPRSQTRRKIEVLIGEVGLAEQTVLSGFNAVTSVEDFGVAVSALRPSTTLERTSNIFTELQKYIGTRPESSAKRILRHGL